MSSFEHPDTTEVLTILTQEISNALAAKKYLLAGICTNVFVSRIINNFSKKIDAIEIKIVRSSSDEYVLYVPYEITPNKVITLGEVFTIE